MLEIMTAAGVGEQIKARVRMVVTETLMTTPMTTRVRMVVTESLSKQETKARIRLVVTEALYVGKGV